MLTDAQVKQLLQELEKKITLDRGIQCRNLIEDIPPNGREDGRIFVRSDSISGTYLGDFRHIIKEYTVELVIWIQNTDQENPDFVTNLNFYYTHHDGGKNGCSMNFRIIGTIGDDWTKFRIKLKYVKEEN